MNSPGMCMKSDVRDMARAERARARKACFAQGKNPCDNLRRVLAAHQGKPTAGYLAIGSEVDPLPVMKELASSTLIGVPVVRRQQQPLLFCRWQQTADTRQGPFGVSEPRICIPMVPQVMIVPLLAFDRSGFRLGYGGGFYDRTLETLRKITCVRAIGLAFAGQEVARLPREPHDQRLDWIVTEDEIIELAT